MSESKPCLVFYDEEEIGDAILSGEFSETTRFYAKQVIDPILKAKDVENERLREALRFYERVENHIGKDHYSSPSQDFPAWRGSSAVQMDMGSIAREALAEPTAPTGGTGEPKADAGDEK